MKRGERSRFAGRLVKAAGTLILAGPLLLVATNVAGASQHQATPAIKNGGTLNVAIQGGQWPGLDPATNTQDAADSTLQDAIYGDLFEQGPNGSIIDDMAQSFSWADHNLEGIITIRPGIKFTDGTPYTAADVASSFERDLTPSFACICDPNFTAVKSVTAKGDDVLVHLSHPFSPLIAAIIGEAPNWAVDPTALNSMGEASYAQHPIGAGPFEVVSNSASASLVLNRNPHYFKKGEPHLAGITFTADASDQTALAAMQAGQIQESIMTTIPLIQQIRSSRQFKVITPPAVAYQFVSLNETKSPFNNILAREALQYATNQKVLVQQLYGGLYKVVDGPTAPGELLYYGAKIPGYRSYNLAKATQLVKQLGGLSVTLATTANTQYWLNEVDALSGMWQAAGIKTTIAFNTLQNTLNQLSTNNWDALDSNWGRYDPAIALPTYFASDGPFTGTHDATLDGLINQLSAFANSNTRLKVNKEIATELTKTAGAVFLYSKNTFEVLSKNVEGNGFANNDVQTLWEDVWMS
jgi:peptide/nickel transport system substrate-binding protein